ncbi:MAG: hypothetical protein AB9866_21355 [Syntrophobacteraceae bacterium]
MKCSKIAFTAIFLGLLVVTAPVMGQAPVPEQSNAIQVSTKVVPSGDSMLSRVEKSDREFIRLENKQLNRVSYFHPRMIGEALVEKDFIRYKFDLETESLVEEKRHWREELPSRLPEVMSKAEAEALVEGEVQYSNLIYISPVSEIYPVKPTPTNPVWVVKTKVDGLPVVAIVDGITGSRLGNGIPPPSPVGLSIHGPDWGACPKDPMWYNHAQNAKEWFDAMGYPTTRIGNAARADLQTAVQSDDTVMFYELDHGGSTSFHNRCDQSILATDIDTWMNGWANMPFAFIGSCEGLCNTGDNTFSYEFRKAASVDTVVVGYCHMDSAGCDPGCWGSAIAWQTELFTHMSHGDTAWTAFGEANLDYPTCAANTCTRFSGDQTLRLVPVVARSFTGGLQGTFSPSNRDHHIRGEMISAGTGLTIAADTTMVFVNNSKLRANAPLQADGAAGEIRFTSEADRTRRIKGTGQLKMQSDGQMKLY